MNGNSSSLEQPKLNLAAELILLLLNEESGYFYQVPGWSLSCALTGAALAELSLQHRVDTDIDLLYLLNSDATGEPILDSILEKIANEKTPRSTAYWIEHLSIHSETIIDSTLERLVQLKVLTHHHGDFWTLAPNSQYTNNIKRRIGKCIFANEIPEPEDAIIVSLCEACNVFRLMYDLDEQSQARIESICKIELIGRSIALAVKQNITSPLLRRSRLTKKIPSVALHKLPFNRNLRIGYIPALFGDLAQEYGPVFQIRLPFREPLYFLAGPESNRWAHRNGRIYLRSRDYFVEFEKVYGAAGLFPSLDGADHFQLRKSLHSAYSKNRFRATMGVILSEIRSFMADWKVGSTLQATTVCRSLLNAQIAPTLIGINSQDISAQLIKYKERALMTHVVNVLPKFMLNTPRMKRAAKAVNLALERVQSSHTPAQRSACPRNLADDLLNLHANNPQFLPESNLGFYFSAPMLASVYVGDALGFALYAMVSQPDMYNQISREADALFVNGDPDVEQFSSSLFDVTKRFVMECLRLYPIIPMSIRNVMNSCTVEGFELPIGTRIHIAQTASHYIDSVFPDPYKFDIDRYLPDREEHRSPGYAPYGLGTHRCLGANFVEDQLAINLMMIAHYFTLELTPANYKLGFDPLPSMSPNRKLKFRITEQRRELPV